MTATANFCPNCGESLAADAKFCAACGQQIGGPVGGAVAAAFGVRLVAWFIDFVLLFVIGAVTAVVIDPPWFLGILIGATYTIGFWTAAAATPGKMAMKLKVVDEKGEPVQIDKAILRYVGYWVSAIILLIGFLMIALRQDNRGLHDLIAGTNVIRTEQ
ncbi:MAG TPA: RDD family protein [Dehalococcoidia bacterium]